MKKRLWITILALLLCLALAPAAQGMMSPEDYGKWLGGDLDCDHSSEKLTSYAMPGDPDTPKGNHLQVTDCQCGAQRVDKKECSDGNGDGKCDGCKEQMPVAQTDLADASVTVHTAFGNNTDYYLGEPITPSVSVTVNGVYMYEGDDYTVSYENNNGPGTAQVVVTATSGGRLKGKVKIPITIKKLNGNLGNSANTVYLFGGNSDGTFNYTGQQIKPDVMVELDDMWTLAGSEYSVEYGPNVNEGKGWVKLTGNGNEGAPGVPITGKRTVYFKIVKAACQHPAESNRFEEISDTLHRVVCGVCGETIETGISHRLYDEVTGNSLTTVTVERCRDCSYSRTKSVVFELNGITWNGIPDQEYTGEPVTPPVTGSAGEYTPVQGQDFTTEYENNVKPGEALVHIKPIEGKSTGEAQKKFNIVCYHFDTTYVSDGISGHHEHCNVCDKDFEIEEHELSEQERDVSDTEVDIYDVCGARGCDFEIANRTEKKLSGASVTGLKGDGETYTEEEARSIGLEGLVKGEDYTQTVTEKTGEDGRKYWVIENKPVDGKSRGEKVIEVKKYCPHTAVTAKWDNLNHWVECDECHAELYSQPHAMAWEWTNEEHYEACGLEACGYERNRDAHQPRQEQRNETETTVDLATVCAQDGCGWTGDTVTVKKLEGTQVSGLKGAGEEYYENEAKNIGLEGLTKGEDYTQIVTEKTGDGGKQTWVIEIKPVDGKTIGERVIEVPKKQCDHLTVTWDKDAEDHWFTCHVCGYTSIKGEHAFSEARVVTAATCTQDAVLERSCICGQISDDTGPHAGDPDEWFAHHTWGEEYESDSFYHWTRCTVCQEPSEKEDHACVVTSVYIKPDCTENGACNAECTVCHKPMLLSAGLNSDLAMCPGLAEYKALGHDFSGPLKYVGKSSFTAEGEGTHAKSCIRCGIPDDKNQSPHAWGGWDYISQGSCGDANDPVIRTASCECSAKLTLTYPREHTLVADTSQDVQPTCTEPGKINGQRCTICGNLFQEDVKALGHDMQVIDKLDATCETTGFINRKCSRCDHEETEYLKTLSPDGHHHFEPVASKEPTCLTEGSYNGEKCKYCPAEQAGETGYGTIPALGHLVKKESQTVGHTKDVVTNHGVIEVTCYEVYFICGRCGHALGHEYYTVGTNPKISKYLIEPGKNVKITDLSNGIHIDGNMANDGGVYFNNEVKNAFGDVLDGAGQKYTYKKVPANSFIIEFTDEFLAEQQDGDYELIVINGDEYWPMIVTVQDHLFTAVRPIEETENVPEWSMEEYEAWVRKAAEDGCEIKELFQGCAYRQPTIREENGGRPNENGEIVVTKFDGDYAFDALVNGEYILEPDRDYTLDGDTVTVKAEYLSTLSGASEITFRYAPLPEDGAPLPQEPKLTLQD